MLGLLGLRIFEAKSCNISGLVPAGATMLDQVSRVWRTTSTG
jgi:hypothetical protein